MVVFPEPLGPRRPMTSPAPTSSDTPSTASLGPYHFVSLSATMMGLMMNDPARERRDGRAAPALALLGGGGTFYSQNSGACFIAFHASGSCAVKKLASSLACISRMKS